MTDVVQQDLVLVVDDEPVSRDMVKLNLDEMGYRTLTAANGLAALALIHEHRPRIIISDWLMPQMDGLQVCKEVRAMQKNDLFYFIMLTVQSDKKRIMEAFDAGIDDFLSKPFHTGELLARVRVGAKIVRMYEELNMHAQSLIQFNAELSKLNEKLRLAATVDDMTKLFNRRQAMVSLREQWAISKRYGTPLTCAMIDVDHFKCVNDTYGHLKGDEILQKIGLTLPANVRAADSVYRMGGEEFMILFPNQQAHDALHCLQRCLAAVESTISVGDNPSRPITISAGIAERALVMRNVDDLLRAADSALYVAKREGRNRVSTATDGAGVFAAAG